jgi:hypothetical protein
MQNYRINTFESFSDLMLQKCWLKLQDATECHPQLYYEWVEIWWNYNNTGRNLHIVTVQNENSNIVGIAPLCIEKKHGLKILRSIPVKFGDFFSFLIQSGDYEAIFKEIISYLGTFDKWDYFYLHKISAKDFLYNNLSGCGLYYRHRATILSINISDVSFSEYLKTLSKKTRFNFQYNLKRTLGRGILDFQIIEDYSGFLNYRDTLIMIYEKRWSDNKKSLRPQRYYQMEKEAIEKLFFKKKVILFVLKLNDIVISYRWGFINDNKYFDWRVCFNPEYNKYSPGILALGLAIEALIKRGYKEYNFGAGDYEWKRHWATPGMESSNYDILSVPKNKILPKVYLYYYLKWKPLAVTYMSKLKYLMKS